MQMKTLKALFLSLRPNQWIKNLFLFSGILFSQNLTNISMLDKVIAGFIVFCALSGTVYLLNDIIDHERDRSHPVKSLRPIASGAISRKTALISSTLLMLFTLAGSYLLGVEFFLVSVLYLTLQVAYSFFLKHIVILDVFTISAGFVLRVFAGALVIRVEVSSWLIICTMLLSLFLGLSKRRHEIVTLEDNAESHRQVLTEYSSYLLDQMISVITASTLICYALYTMSAETIERFGTNKLIFTVPFVLYGIFRYLYLVHKKGGGGNPESIITSDKPLLINIFLWVLTAGLIIYF
jgi:4-hydroxybenzoate polyprenyltransferase